MNALIRIKNAAPVVVIALSLVTATATTTDVIYSFDDDEGEYADTDLVTDNAGNIYGTTVTGRRVSAAARFSNSAPDQPDRSTPSSTVSPAARTAARPTRGVTIDRSGNFTARQSPAVSGGSRGRLRSSL